MRLEAAARNSSLSMDAQFVQEGESSRKTMAYRDLWMLKVASDLKAVWSTPEVA